MKIITAIEELRENLAPYRQEGKIIGLVPTMGYLHEGHLTLVKEAKKACDIVVMSIFVNPLQFGAGEDYEEYPRDLTRDGHLAREAGVDIIFAPTVKEMYPRGHRTFVEVEGLTEGLCGSSRPGHFRGVTTVVAKLFNIVQPQRAYFGQKDAQQLVIIKRMTEDLNLPIKISGVPIVRENDGLAMSSRNAYLSPEERKAALVLFRSLQLAKEMVEGGERRARILLGAMEDLIGEEPLAVVDYVEIRNANTLEAMEWLEGSVLIALAVRIGKTRLIDNIILEV